MPRGHFDVQNVYRNLENQKVKVKNERIRSASSWIRTILVSETDAEEIAEAKPHSKKYEVLMMVGERGQTRRTKQFRVQWKDYSVTTWELATNLDHCK